MIGSIHYEPNARGYLTEFANNQFIAHEFKQIKDILLKVINVLRIIIVGIISYNNLRIVDDIF